MIIETYRGDGLRAAPAITEPMLSDDALIHRGRAELNANAHQVNQVSAGVVFRPGIRLGQIIQTTDPTTATAQRGKVTGIAISIAHADISTTLTLEQPAS